ncbi:MAG: F0F1 ATP synthase subunit gamma [Candidatus Omnitrophota bacterium]
MKLLSQLKTDLEFNRNLASIIEVLKEIAISQYHVMEKRIKTYDKIFSVLGSLFEILPADSADIKHPLLDLGNRTPGVIAVTSDTGLLGPLNMQVISLAIKEAEGHNAKLIIIGEKGKVYAQEYKVDFVAFPGIKDDARFSQAMQLRDFIVGEELNQKLGPIKIFYPYAASIMAQRVQSLQLLPPETPSKSARSPLLSETILESSAGDVASYLVYLMLGQKFYEVFGLSRLAELAARFVHLEESGHKLEDLKKQLQLQYFRTRHELIDRNMRELFAARLVFK